MPCVTAPAWQGDAEKTWRRRGATSWRLGKPHTLFVTASSRHMWRLAHWKGTRELPFLADTTGNVIHAALVWWTVIASFLSIFWKYDNAWKFNPLSKLSSAPSERRWSHGVGLGLRMPWGQCKGAPGQVVVGFSDRTTLHRLHVSSRHAVCRFFPHLLAGTCLSSFKPLPLVEAVL